MGKKQKGGGSKRPPELPSGGSFAEAFERADAEREKEAVAPVARPPERISSPFKNALGPLKKQLEAQAKKAADDKKRPVVPAPVKPVARKKKGLAEDDSTALSLAMQGVVPLGGARPGRVGATTPKIESRTAMVVPFGKSAEDEARARLDDLVANEVNFRIESDRDYVRGSRVDAPARVVRELARRMHVSEKLDLHGMTQREARDAVVAFVRASHRRGLTVVAIVHGKGQHSEGGIGVLRDVALDALTKSGASQLVYAFCNAADALGGAGALIVELKH